EIVHSCTFFTNFAAWYATLGTGAIPIGAVRSDFMLDRQESGPLLGRLCSRWPRHQIYNSVSAADNASKSAGPFVPREMRVVRNAVDMNRFPRVPIPLDGRVFIQGIGSLVAVKRWDRLLKAASRLHHDGYKDSLVRIAG